MNKEDRLAKAREARFAKNPPQYKQYSPCVVALPDDHDFSMKNVREWIKEAKAHKASEHRSHMAGVKGALARREMWNAYAGQLESYLRSGAYCSMFAGGNMEKKVERACVAMAYFNNGKPKREFGVWYPDYRCKWTPELENDERVAYGMKPLEFNEHGHIMVTGKSKPTKKRKKREMTEEQKAAFVERMRKAREKKDK